jgi:hypothetical protein
MLNTARYNIPKLINIYQGGYKNLVSYKRKKGIYINKRIKYYKTDKMILMNNTNVALPSHPYHIVDQSP